MPTAAQAAAAAYPSPVLYFSHPACLEHDPGALMPGHPDTPERLLALEAHLGERGWLGWERREAPAAREADLERVHSRRRDRRRHLRRGSVLGSGAARRRRAV